MNTAVQTVVNALADCSKFPKPSGNGEFKALCPAHDDQKPSLQVGQGEKGAVVFCQAGCKTDDVLLALNLLPEQLFDDYGAKAETAAPTRAAAKGASATYFYDDELGNVLYRVERHPNKKFMMARPDSTNPGEWLYNMGDTRRVPYRLPSLRRSIADGETVFVVEGEKDVERLEAEGFVGTCNPGGAGKWKRDFNVLLAGAHVVLLPDNDDAGQSHMLTVQQGLTPECRTLRRIELPGLEHKGDVSDWFAAGHTGAELLDLVAAAEVLATNTPAVFTAESLMKEEFPPVTMAVPGVICEGVTFLVGAPKIGKSWMSMGLALSVATGNPALGVIPVEQGDALYLSLEDTPPRLQRRMTVMLGQGAPAPAELHFACRWPRMAAGGLDQLDSWLREHPNTRMVIIDTWAKFKSNMGDGDTSLYAGDYAAVAAVKEVADTFGVAIVLIHHQRKATDGDILNTVAGSVGLTGAADGICVLTRPRGKDEGKLFIEGRDVEESTAMLKFEADTGTWLYLGEAEEVEEQRTETLIIKFCEDAVPQTVGPKDIAAEFPDLKEGTVKWLLSKMAQEEKLVRVARGQYTVAANAQAVANGPRGSGPAVASTPGAVVTPGIIASTSMQPPIPGTGGFAVPAGPMAVDLPGTGDLPGVGDGFEVDPDDFEAIEVPDDLSSLDTADDGDQGD